MSASRFRTPVAGLDRADRLIALGLGISSLAAYVRTLAPDVLYGDSAELQTLAYTLGQTHPTGYPTYLLLARLIGCVPLGNPAWRINLLSAVCAALTVAGVYLLARGFTGNRTGPILGSLALAISHTFWSQAVVAEVYTPAMALLTAVMLLLIRWQSRPAERPRSLFLAAALIAMGAGVHASAGLIAPPAALFVIWVSLSKRTAKSGCRRQLLTALAGGLAGAAVFWAAFWICDRANAPSSYTRVVLYPSRCLWGLGPGDLASPWQRLWLSFSGLQWRDYMFTGGGHHFGQAAGVYFGQLTSLEFPWVIPLLALGGTVVAFMTRRAPAGLLAAAFFCSLFFILNYGPVEERVFSLSTYISLAALSGVGLGFLLEFVRDRLPATRSILVRQAPLAAAVAFTGLIVLPSGASRWEALQRGAATFVQGDVGYPIRDLTEPRHMAEWRLARVPDHAVLVLDWRALHAVAFIAQVEEHRRDMIYMEATPHSSGNKVAATLLADLVAAVRQGRPAFTDAPWPGLEQEFVITPFPDSRLYRLTSPGLPDRRPRPTE